MMRQARLIRLLGLVDGDLIEEAGEPVFRKKRRRIWPAAAAGVGAAACLALALTVGRTGNAAPGDASGSAGGSGHGEGFAFMSYAGPVFPLTTVEDVPLTAERTLTWDFAPGTYRDGSPRQWGAVVTDRYLLTNPTAEPVTVEALYPFAGDFYDLSQQRPAITVDGAEAETELLAGPYSGGFSSAYGPEDPDHDTLNLAELNSWEEYQTLLSDGKYQALALAETPVPDIPAVVYKFSDFTAPREQYQAATQAITFTMDPAATQILTYGFNGMSADWDTGWMRYDFFVPDGVTRETPCKLLVVLGEDLQGYVLQGYQNGGCKAGEELEDVSCTVTRRETTLDAVLETVCRDYRDFYDPGTPDESEGFTPAMHVRAVSEFLAQYGLLSDAPKDRYTDGRLDDLVSEALHIDRVLYLRFPVVIPAGGSVTVEAALWKEPSFDFYCGRPEDEQVQGYDLVTQLGSGLVFTGQTAALKNTETIELVRQNFGFDPDGGVTEVPLDLSQEHYYLELRERP